jgi:uncharacterized protein
VFAALWIWRRQRASTREPVARDRPSSPPPDPTRMVACRHCGLHLPQADAIADAQGHYCSVEHLRLQRLQNGGDGA